MSFLRVSEAAGFLGVSDDSVRRWISAGKLTEHRDDSGRTVVDGVEVARLARDGSGSPETPELLEHSSARNNLRGLVTKITSDTVMSQVEVQCGPFRVVSLISTEAVHELGLEPGKPVTAKIKATNVMIEDLNL